jgi:4'-phosphopantetheinyl transferase
MDTRFRLQTHECDPGIRPTLIRAGEIQLWSVNLQSDDGNLAVLSRLLTDEELRRADRFRFGDDRRRFIVARSTLRLLLADYTGRHAGSLEIRTDSFGKPFLRAVGTPLHFNLSHSGDRALIVFSRDASVGIDFEAISHEDRLTDLAESICSPAELIRIGGMPYGVRCRALLRLWSAKEAFLKAMGTGLQINPSRLELSPGVAEGSSERGAVRWIDSPGASSRYLLQPLPDCERRLGGSAALVASKLRTSQQIVWMGSPRPIGSEYATT